MYIDMLYLFNLRLRFIYTVYVHIMNGIYMYSEAIDIAWFEMGSPCS